MQTVTSLDQDLVCCTVEAGPPLKLLLDFLLLFCVMELLQLCVCRTGPFTCSSSSHMGWILGWANIQPWSVGSAALVIPPALPCSHHQGEPSCTALVSSPLAGRMRMSKGQGQLPCFQALSLGSSEHKVRASSTVLPRKGAGATFPSAAAGKGEGQLPCLS